MYKHFLFVLIVALGFTSCHDDPTYRVDSTLNDYLQRFLYQAELRGKTFNLKEQGLIIEYGNLEDNVAGRTYYENPIRIVIDKPYWDNLAKYSSADEMREDIIFHELGHGLLNREHINDYLPNGDWKSIMCGGTVKDNRSWNINYRSIRRQYYLDELFNPQTPTPTWATTTFTGSTTETAVDLDEFNTALFWPTGINTNYNASVANGIYSFQNLGTAGTFLVRSLPLQSTADFYIETSIKIVATSADTQCGIMFGNGNTPISGNYFNINNNKRMFMGNSECFGWYTELLESGINPNDYNTIAIRKVGSNVYYYINGQCVYYDQLTINKLGTDFGFEVAGSCTLLIDYFHVYSSTLRAAVIVDTSVKQPIQMNTNKGVWLNK